MSSIVKELGLEDEPAWLGALSVAHRATLLVAIQTERARRTAELRAAIDAALEHVPWLLRVALRKVLFP
jgi:hypothetical protein